MVLVAKEPSLCNHKPKEPSLCNHKLKEPSLCNQIWVNWLFGSVLVGDFFGGGEETKASDWLSGAFATVKKIVFYCFF